MLNREGNRGQATFCGASGSCGGGNPGIIYAHEERADANDDWQRTVEYTLGVGITGSMSGSASNPWVATGLPGGSGNNKAVVLVELIGYGSINVPTYEWQYRSENQQRSLLGTTNEHGERRSEVDYNEYGQPYLKKILWDGSRSSYIEDVQQTEEMTEIYLSSTGITSQPITSNMLGALVRVSAADTSPYVLFGRVVSVDLPNDIFNIEDPNGDLYTLITGATDPVITVFDHHDANIGSATHTAGLWTSNPSPGSGQTTFTIGTSVMPTHIVGWTLQPDARYPVFYTITAASSNTVSVAGDITGTLPDVTETDVFYMLIPPAGVDKATGALSQDPLQPVTRYLAFQYHYQPPVAGADIESEIYGRQSYANLAGGHYAWLRRYDPMIGRWTTSDPDEDEWSNLISYAGEQPTLMTDPTGAKHPCYGVLNLDQIKYATERNDCDWLTGVRDKLVEYEGHSGAGAEDYIRDHHNCYTWLNGRIYEACREGAPARPVVTWVDVNDSDQSVLDSLTNTSPGFAEVAPIAIGAFAMALVVLHYLLQEALKTSPKIRIRIDPSPSHRPAPSSGGHHPPGPLPGPPPVESKRRWCCEAKGTSQRGPGKDCPARQTGIGCAKTRQEAAKAAKKSRKPQDTRLLVRPSRRQVLEGMNVLKLVSTYEMVGVRTSAQPQLQFDLRIEIFVSPTEVFSCRVWIVEEFRILPTNADYNRIVVGDPDCYADKYLSVLMDAHDFDQVQCGSEEDARATAVAMIRELFDGVGADA